MPSLLRHSADHLDRIQYIFSLVIAAFSSMVVAILLTPLRAFAQAKDVLKSATLTGSGPMLHSSNGLGVIERKICSLNLQSGQPSLWEESQEELDCMDPQHHFHKPSQCQSSLQHWPGRPAENTHSTSLSTQMLSPVKTNGLMEESSAKAA